MQVLSGRRLSLDALYHPVLRFALGYWRDMRRDRIAPSWEELQLDDIQPFVHAQTTAVRVRRHPLDFEFIHWGQGVTQTFGVDLCGRSAAAIMPKSLADLTFCQLMEAATSRQPQVYLNDLPKRSQFAYQIAVLRLPLSSNGRDIDVILSVDDYGPNVEAMRGYFAEIGRGKRARRS